MTDSGTPAPYGPAASGTSGGEPGRSAPPAPVSAPFSAPVSAPPADARAPLAAWLCVLLGVAAAVVGLLPWLVTGMRLPLQNLWAFETAPERMPIVLLPFSQYALTTIVGVIVTGSAVAGVVARALRRRMPRRGFAGMFVGTLAVQAVALVQTAVTVQRGLQGRAESAVYLAGLVALTVFSILVGALVLWLIARAPRAGALIGLAFGSIAVGFWASALLRPVLGSGTVEAIWLSSALRWLPAVLVGAAIAWCGVSTVGRAIAAIAALLLLWLAPALATAVTSAVGSRVLAAYPAEMLDYGLGVFAMASTIPELVLPPLVVAIVVAGIGLVARAVLPRPGGDGASGAESGAEPGAVR